MEYRILGARVRAISDVYDGGHDADDTFHHAKPGDLGTIEYLPEFSADVVTVRFDSGTATDCVLRVPNQDREPEVEYVEGPHDA